MIKSLVKFILMQIMFFSISHHFLSLWIFICFTLLNKNSSIHSVAIEISLIKKTFFSEKNGKMNLNCDSLMRAY